MILVKPFNKVIAMDFVSEGLPLQILELVLSAKIVNSYKVRIASFA